MCCAWCYSVLSTKNRKLHSHCATVMTFMAAQKSALNRATETKVTIMKLSRWKVCGARCRFVEPNLKYVTARYVAPRAEWCHEFLISRNKQLLINKIIPQNIFIFSHAPRLTPPPTRALCIMFRKWDVSIMMFLLSFCLPVRSWHSPRHHQTLQTRRERQNIMSIIISIFRGTPA